MAVYFAAQSRAINRITAEQGPARTPRLPDVSRLLTSAEWVAYFRANAAQVRPLLWGRGAEVTDEELAAISRSLQAWQLGETSDGVE
jgi:hypothetical protein